MLALYLTKTAAGSEGARLIEVNRKIAEEQRRVKLLKAELAYLEQPRRIERLAQNYLALQPLSAKHEAQPAALAEIARQSNTARPGAPFPGSLR